MIKVWAKTLSILLLTLILIAAFFRHTLCRLLIEKATIDSAGLTLSIEDLNLDVLNNSLYIRGVTLFNPPGFKNEVLGKAEEIFIRYDLPALLSGRVHLRLARAKINEINIIRDEKGKSNLSVQNVLSVSPAQKETQIGKKEKKSKFLIDTLQISLAKVAFINYKAEIGKPAVIIFTAEGQSVFKNVTNLGNVLSSVSAKRGLRDLLVNSGTTKKH